MQLLLCRGYVLRLYIGALGRRISKVGKILSSGLCRWRRTFEDTDPPRGRIERAMVVVQWRVNIVEEVPD